MISIRFDDKSSFQSAIKFEEKLFDGTNSIWFLPSSTIFKTRLDNFEKIEFSSKIRFCDKSTCSRCSVSISTRFSTVKRKFSAQKIVRRFFRFLFSFKLSRFCLEHFKFSRWANCSRFNSFSWFLLTSSVRSSGKNRSNESSPFSERKIDEIFGKTLRPTGKCARRLPLKSKVEVRFAKNSKLDESMLFIERRSIESKDERRKFEFSSSIGFEAKEIVEIRCKTVRSICRISFPERSTFLSDRNRSEFNQIGTVFSSRFAKLIEIKRLPSSFSNWDFPQLTKRSRKISFPTRRDSTFMFDKSKLVKRGKTSNRQRIWWSMVTLKREFLRSSRPDSLRTPSKNRLDREKENSSNSLSRRLISLKLSAIDPKTIRTNFPFPRSTELDFETLYGIEFRLRSQTSLPFFTIRRPLSKTLFFSFIELWSDRFS